MASKRVCPHTITLFNYMGEDAEGKAQYSQTLLQFVHFRDGQGVNSGDTPADSTRLHIFDDTVLSEKGFMPYTEWVALPSEEKPVYWTISVAGAEGGGTDYFAVGDHRSNSMSLPTVKELFRITDVIRHAMGRRRMWHWRIEAR